MIGPSDLGLPGGKASNVIAAECEVAQNLAGRLGMSAHIQAALGQAFERWDGKGLPAHVKGAAIPLSLRLVQLAQDVELFHRVGGLEAALAIARQRAGGAYDPEVVACFCRQATQLCATLDAEATWDAVLAADYVEHTPGLPPDFPTGLEGFKQYVSLIRAAFPDFRYTVEDEIAAGDKAALRLTARGTNTGPLFGLPASGKPATWTEMHIGRWAGGKLVEHWASIDQLGLLQQVGAIPAPAPAAR